VDPDVMRFLSAINRRLDRIEEHLVLLADTVHVPYATYAQSLNIPDDVVALAREGKRLEAMKRYRELTGANIRQAEEILAAL
jgi:ribosomal protein L7/L12